MSRFLRSIHLTGFLTDEVDILSNTSTEKEIDIDQIWSIKYFDLVGNEIENQKLKDEIELAYRKAANDTAGN